mmetsp:Transcript_38482/g.97645  ORF Transcript_38482/g.97645 Transcript_38482/m.97645 type:complete len:535 (-) Transcript_38482:109-1713(-)
MLASRGCERSHELTMQCSFGQRPCGTGSRSLGMFAELASGSVQGDMEHGQGSAATASIGSRAVPSGFDFGVSSYWDRRWNVLDKLREGWDAWEHQPEPPRSDAALASLLHGDGPEYFAYACVLGRRLRDEAGSNAPDRVLLCGPGACTSSASSRKALRQAGWTHLLPVEPIEAEHLDKTKTKRHALVFTKLRVLEVPYERVLLLDLDLLPRAGVDMAELLKIIAPAGKYHCNAYQGPEPDHGCEIPERLRTSMHCWSPNAGVMRFDPLATLECRKKLVATMVKEVSERSQATYLPEQYYLAEKVSGWRHISSEWNWEVWPEWEDPRKTHPAREARSEAKRQGSSWMYGRRSPHGSSSSSYARVWHFSGTGETSPFYFMHLNLSADKVHEEAQRFFKHRDKSGMVAEALREWTDALSNLLRGAEASDLRCTLQAAVELLSQRALQERARGWICDGCKELRLNVRHLPDVPYGGKYCSLGWSELNWACADCVVQRLRDTRLECRCSRGVCKRCGWFGATCDCPPAAGGGARGLPWE